MVCSTRLLLTLYFTSYTYHTSYIGIPGSLASGVVAIQTRNGSGYA